MELRGHGNNHVIEVGVEVTTLGHIKTEWRSVVVTCEQVVWVVSETRLVSSSLGKLWWPNTLVCIFSLMNSHVWWPNSVMDLTLSEVPLLEVVRAVLLMTWVNLREIDHLASEFNLGETFVD